MLRFRCGERQEVESQSSAHLLLRSGRTGVHSLMRSYGVVFFSSPRCQPLELCAERSGEQLSCRCYLQLIQEFFDRLGTIDLSEISTILRGSDLSVLALGAADSAQRNCPERRAIKQLSNSRFCFVRLFASAPTSTNHRHPGSI